MLLIKISLTIKLKIKIGNHKLLIQSNWILWKIKIQAYIIYKFRILFSGKLCILKEFFIYLIKKQYKNIIKFKIY
jgi:hypothetical protein